MILLHATPTRNRPSILRVGILTSTRRGKIGGCWLHTPSRTKELLRHLAAWHGVPVSKLCVIKVNVPRGWLRHHDGRRGIWISHYNVPPERIAK